ncbi:MAG: hypothetical protein M1492_15115 [Gammaproteobacteria bacterium]|uniref:hypothetical protein n=1 Tax=Acidithiobacillus ferrooxidans TaxID=920 RepID=UPI001C0683C0|nr:hypothetical protein [Acidithiobacillus ferrooxidans]MCL4527741.1 hypothetical protein [Gammaproteobacteria bacterium]
MGTETRISGHQNEPPRHITEGLAETCRHQSGVTGFGHQVFQAAEQFIIATDRRVGRKHHVLPLQDHQGQIDPAPEKP